MAKPSYDPGQRSKKIHKLNSDLKILKRYQKINKLLVCAPNSRHMCYLLISPQPHMGSHVVGSTPRIPTRYWGPDGQELMIPLCPQYLTVTHMHRPGPPTAHQKIRNKRPNHRSFLWLTFSLLETSTYLPPFVCQARPSQQTQRQIHGGPS